MVSITDDGGLSGAGTTTVTVNPLTTPTPEPVTATFNSSGDTYVKNGQDNHNYGAGLFMNLQSSGSIISNQAKNCSGSTEWEMGQPNNPAVHPWNATATATQTIHNNQSGVVEYDVTADVASFMNGSKSNYGWLLKKTTEGQNGQVSFGTKESTSVPQLVVTYQP